MKNNVVAATFVTSGSLVMGANAVLARGAHSDGHSNNASVGQAGKGGHVDRQIEVEMGEMFFSTGSFDIRKGETIRFVVTNSGGFVHEFNIRTAEMHSAHAKEMAMMMDSGVLERTGLIMA